MLPLYGTATAICGFVPGEQRQVLRLRSPQQGPEQLADVALVRQPRDFDDAVSAGFAGALVVDDRNEPLPHLDALPRMVQLSGKFDYLADEIL